MLAIRLLQLFSDDRHDLKKLVSLLGLFFQIRDDYANLMLAEVSLSFKIHLYRLWIYTNIISIAVLREQEFLRRFNGRQVQLPCHPCHEQAP